MKKLTVKHSVWIGFTLFSMFFGAGNLIFPPLLGAQSGTHFIFAMFGFILTAVLMPTLAVLVVAKHQGLKKLTDRIHPYFTIAFVTLVYLLIGPCVAIPRTASTSFEMAFSGFFSDQMLTISRIIYSFLFFTLASLVALHPNRLKNILGKVMTPVLLILISVVFIALCISINLNVGDPYPKYLENPMISGLVDGYQTMDILAALNFGIVIAINIRDLGVTDSKCIAREIMKAGLLAGFLLIIVYMMTGYIGMYTSGYFDHVNNGAQVLVYAIENCFGSMGKVLVGIIFFIACFNVCVGLLSCCSQYFYEQFPKFSYKKWLYGFALFSFVISCFGLDFILKISLPILSFMCPLAIVIVILGIFLKPKSQ